MNDRLVTAAFVWSIGVLFASYLYRAMITDARYDEGTVRSPAPINPISQSER